MTSTSKNVYVDKLDIVNKYNNTCYKTIKIKLVDVKSSMYIDFNEENDQEASKFEVGDYLRISKYKNIFAKGYIPNCSEEDFLIEKIKNNVLWTYVISDLNGEEIVGT